MNCRIIAAHKLRKYDVIKQYNVILTNKTITADENNKFIWRRRHANTT